MESLPLNIPRQPLRKLTDQEIEDAKSPCGGWTKKQLLNWGVNWPPRKGWRRALLRGTDPNA